MTTAPTPKYGGVLKIIEPPYLIRNLGYIPTEASFNLSTEASFNHNLSIPAVENLVGLNPDGSGDPIPQLATNWEYNADYTTLTFHLQQGVKFHDGTPFNAETAKYCLDLVKDSGARAELKTVTSIAVLDDYTIQLNLSEYDPLLVKNLNLAGVGVMVSPTALKTMGEGCRFHPVGTGPFKFVSYKRDILLTYVRNDNYWREGKPYLDGIEFHIIKDLDAAVASFQAGEVQAIHRPQHKAVIDMQKTGKYDVRAIPVASFGLIGDSKHPDSPYSDMKVRQAIAHAIDNEAIAEAIGYGLLQPTNQLAHHMNWYYNPDVVGYPYDVKKAKALLAQTNYPNGFDTYLQIEAIPDLINFATMVQSYLAEIEIKVKVEAVEVAIACDTRSNGWEDGMVMMMFPTNIERDAGSALLSMLSSEASFFDPKTVYIPPDYDAALHKTYMERDPEKRKAMIRNLQKMIIDDYCIVTPVYIACGRFANTWQVKNCAAHKPYGGGEWAPENVWLDD